MSEYSILQYKNVTKILLPVEITFLKIYLFKDNYVPGILWGAKDTAMSKTESLSPKVYILYFA